MVFYLYTFSLKDDPLRGKTIKDEISLFHRITIKRSRAKIMKKKKTQGGLKKKSPCDNPVRSVTAMIRRANGRLYKRNHT
jgi:hypothetical protein